MSNTRKPGNEDEFKTWDQFVKEAERPPYRLPVSGKATIVIDAPTGQQVIDAQRLYNSGDVEKQLEVICGSAADTVIPMVKEAPAGAMNALISAIMKHFDVEEEDSGEEGASRS